MTGHYVTGCDKAHDLCAKYDAIFKCRMFGTFNVKMADDFDINAFAPAIVDEEKGFKFWLTKVDGRFYAWAFKWQGSRLGNDYLELISKERLPELLKSKPLEIEIMQRMSDDEIRRWAVNKYWFQSFPWSPIQRADSRLIWDTINHIEWPGKQVLDIGCHYGFHSFEASKAGARVTGFDTNRKSIAMAQIINDRIEMQDVQFTVADSGGVHWDVIFYFSVHHQIDPEYSYLGSKIKELRARAKEFVFVELIVPPLKSKMTESEIIRIVGGRVLLKYNHLVRGMRMIFEIKAGEK